MSLIKSWPRVHVISSLVHVMTITIDCKQDYNRLILLQPLLALEARLSARKGLGQRDMKSRSAIGGSQFSLVLAQMKQLQ